MPGSRKRGAHRRAGVNARADIVSLGMMHDPNGLGQTAHESDVRLDHMHPAPRNERVKLIQTAETLAPRNRDLLASA